MRAGGRKANGMQPMTPFPAAPKYPKPPVVKEPVAPRISGKVTLIYHWVDAAEERIRAMGEARRG